MKRQLNLLKRMFIGCLVFIALSAFVVYAMETEIMHTSDDLVSELEYTRKDVTIKAKGSFPKDSTIELGKTIDINGLILTDKSVVKTVLFDYDIHIKDKGVDFEPNSNVKIKLDSAKINLDTEVYGDNLVVEFVKIVDKTDNILTVEEITDYELRKGRIEFVADSMGEYALIVVNKH